MATETVSKCTSHMQHTQKTGCKTRRFKHASTWRARHKKSTNKLRRKPLVICCACGKA